MRKTKRASRIFSLLLVLIMLAGMMPGTITALATEGNAEETSSEIIVETSEETSIDDPAAEVHIGTTTEENVNVYETPDTESDVVAVIAEADTQVAVKQVVSSDDDIWYLVETEDEETGEITGYVRSDFMEYIMGADEEIVIFSYPDEAISNDTDAAGEASEDTDMEETVEVPSADTDATEELSENTDIEETPETTVEERGEQPAESTGPRRIIINPPVPTHTFVFWNGGTEHARIILKGTETLSQPENPEQMGLTFLGWYEDAAFTTRFDGFGKIAVTDNSTTNVYAKFGEAWYLTYYDQNGDVIKTEAVEKGSDYTFSPNRPPFSSGALAMQNTGWKDQNGVTHTTDTITVTQDLTMMPILQPGYWVRFHPQGGSAILSQFVPIGGTATKPADPTRKGYAFDGWYDAASGGNPFDFDTVLTGNVNLYAWWSPVETEYTLVFMMQNADDDGYTFHSSYQKTGVTGTMTALNAADNDHAAAKINGDTCYFVNTNKTVHQMIEADGSTVVTVYCDRVWWTIRYNGTDYPVRWGSARTHFNVPALEALWGANSLLNLYYNNKYVTVYFLTEGTFHNPYVLNNVARLRAGVTTELPIGAVLTTRLLDNSGPYVYPSDIYYETPNSTDTNKEYDVLSSAAQSRYDDQVFSDWSDTRFTLERVENVTNRNGEYYFIRNSGYVAETAKAWYTRNKYDILFFEKGGSAVSDISQVFYDMPLANYKPSSYEEGVTQKVEDGTFYTFSGWYKDSTATFEPIDWENAVMPDANLSLYAGWEPVTYTVTFDLNGGVFSDSGESASAVVNYGDMVQEPSVPVKNGWEFIGWTLNGQPYDFASPVTGDITLVAQYATNTHYSVTYAPGEGSGTAFADGEDYLTDSSALVRSFESSGFTPPDGKFFLYWQDGEGNIYLPGEVLTIEDSSVTLTAIYGAPEEKTSLIYDLNYPAFGITTPAGVTQRDVTTVADVPNNSTITLRTPMAAEIPEGYTFGGWYLTEDCAGEALTEIMIDAEEQETANIVYAKWERIIHDLTICKTVSGGMGNKTRYFPFTITVNVPGMTSGTVAIDLNADVIIPANAYDTETHTNPTEITITDGIGTATVWLQHNQSFTVSLPYGATYTVTEPDTDYDESYKINGGAKTPGNSVDGTLTADTTITFDNYLNAPVPTGIYLSIAPALVGIALAGLLLTVLFIGRRRREYE